MSNTLKSVDSNGKTPGAELEIPRKKETWGRTIARLASAVTSVAIGVFVGFKAFCLASASLAFVPSVIAGTAAALAISFAVYAPFQAYESLIESTRRDYYQIGLEEGLLNQT